MVEIGVRCADGLRRAEERRLVVLFLCCDLRASWECDGRDGWMCVCGREDVSIGLSERPIGVDGRVSGAGGGSG